MHAAVVHSFSAPPRYETFTEPAAGEGEALATVTAAGLHPIVKALAAGKHYGSTTQPPFIAGVDGVGRLEDGSRVFFGLPRAPFGTFAERCTVNRSACMAIPDSLEDTTVAAMMNPGMSSWAALTVRARFLAGEKVLILGATGSAGQMAVQIARRLGAGRVVASGRNPEALAELQTLGADSVISLSQDREALVSAFREELTTHKIDVVLDYVWGAPAEALLAAVAQKGLQHAAPRLRYVQIGSSAGPAITLQASILRSSGLELLGSGFGSVSVEKLFESMAHLLRAAAEEPFRLKIRLVPLSEVEARWSAPESAGRLVFQP